MQKLYQQRAVSNSLTVASQQDMGKASKWMRNFLLGRKEEKEKKKDFAEENEKFSSGILPPTSTVKRRWSFGRSSSKEKVHRNSKSLDLINTNSVEKLATVSLENPQRNVNNLAWVLATSALVETVQKSKPARYGGNRAVADAAATKIQAAFRSYLARRALCALRALVKLQALVRGHLVRKQTTATLRRMHALMSIQVRARFQRIQMAEESHIVLKSHSSRYRINPLENQFRRTHREALAINNYETLAKSKYDNLNTSKIGRTKHGVSTRFTGEISFAKREEHQYEEIAFSTAENTHQRYHGMSNTIPGRASFTYQQPDHAQPVSDDFTFLPNYMANTESSKAKARSQSEPRQRPELNLRSRSKRCDSNNGSQHSSPRLKHAVPGLRSNDGSQHSSPRLKHSIHGLLSNDGSERSSPCLNHAGNGNQDPWFMKLYQSKNSESDANSTNTSHSNYCNSLMVNEPPVTLY